MHQKNPIRRVFPNPVTIMVTAKKGLQKLTSGKRTAAFNDAFQVSLNGEAYQQTIRATNCGLLVHGAKCQACTHDRSHLRAMQSVTQRQGIKV